MTKSSGNTLLLDATTRVVAAYVGKNEIPGEKVPGLILTVADAFRPMVEGAPTTTAGVTSAGLRCDGEGKEELLTCQACGRQMKMLKRHLLTHNNLTPIQYRKKYRLPDDAPMVTGAYAARRSELAKQSGLGKRPEKRRGKQSR